MAGTEEPSSVVFDAEAASSLVKELNVSFASGKTRSYDWRVTQLKNLFKLCDENEKEIAEALRLDLSKPELESTVYENPFPNNELLTVWEQVMRNDVHQKLSIVAHAHTNWNSWIAKLLSNPGTLGCSIWTCDVLDYVCVFKMEVLEVAVNYFEAEVAMLKNSCRITLKELKRWMRPEKAKTSLTTFPSSAEIVSEPLGVVLIISAWNYPFLLSLDPVIGAIAAGNALVLKPSEVSPATSSLLLKLVAKYLDNSSIRVVEGAVAETTALLEQKWDKIFYTGNGRVGRIVMAAAAKHLTPVHLELGGKCPVVVDEGINLQVATRRIIAGKWGNNNGQACISPDYIVTTKDNATKLVESFKKELERFYGKNPLESKDLSRIVNFNHFSRLVKLLDEDKVSGKIVYGGERDEVNLRITPTILLDVPRNSLIMKEEIFGPLLPIITVDKLEESFDLINSGTKPLAAYLFTNNKKFRQQFVMSISAGGLVINDTVVHLAVPSLPFGGVGESGTGAYHGKFSFDTFSHKKAVLYRSFASDAAVRYPPYTNWKMRLMKVLIGGGIWDIICALLGWGKA